MKTRILRRALIPMAIALCAAVLTGGAVALNASAAEVLPTLAGFECKGASVNAEEFGVRFVFTLSGDAVQKKDLTAGVVYMPYDLYDGDADDFAKGTEKALETTFKWKDNAETADDPSDLIGYTYLSADSIPSSMYNRILLVRGYIEDGGTVYYSAPVKTSMAYSAWKGLADLPEYEDQLKAYMGPYTLTYEGGKIEDLYYGDPIEGLPTTTEELESKPSGELKIDKWYWDEDKTDPIEESDYVTGSATIYYDFKKVTVSGTVTCDDAIDLTQVKIAVDGVDQNVTVEAGGNFELQVSGGTHDFKFHCKGYVAYKPATFVSEGIGSISVKLEDSLFDIGDYGSTVSTKGLEFNADGNYSISGKGGYAYIMPNTATTGNYEFKITFKDKSMDSDAESYGFVISNGTNVITIAFRGWNVAICVAENGGTGGAYFQVLSTVGYHNVKTDNYTLKRTKDSIVVYYANDTETRHLFTITADGISELDNDINNQYNWTLDESNMTPEGREMLAGFFGENVYHAVGLGSVLYSPSANSTYSLTCSYTELGAVSGKVERGDASGVDLTQVKISVDGAESGAAVSADGSYSLLVPVGSHKFTFRVYGYIAEETKEITADTSLTVTLQPAMATVTGQVTCDREEVAMSELKIMVDGEDTEHKVDVDGSFSFEVQEGKHSFKFYSEKYICEFAQQEIKYGQENKLDVKVDVLATVSGKVTGGSLGDYSSVKIAVDGVETEHTVSSNGDFSFTVKVGTYDFKFYCEGYVAYKLQTVVSDNTALGDIALEDALFDIGDYGATKSTEGLAFNSKGEYTIADTTGGYAYIMPNTATTGNYKFDLKFRSRQMGHDSESYGFVISNGTNAITIAFRAWNVAVKVGSPGGSIDEPYYQITTARDTALMFHGDLGTEYSLIRTRDSLVVKCGDRHIFTITKDGIGEIDKNNNNSGNWEFAEHNITDATKALFAGFFGEDVYHAVGLGSISETMENSTYSLTCSYYGSDVVDSLYYIGDYGSTMSTAGLEFNADGNYSISGKGGYAYIMPNTATTENYEFKITFSAKAMKDDNESYGFVISNGTNVITIAFRGWNVAICVAKNGGSGGAYFQVTGTAGYHNQATDNYTLKRTKDSIVVSYEYEPGVGQRHLFTITKDGISELDHDNNNQYNWTLDESNMTQDGREMLAGFFGEGVSHAVGLGSLLFDPSANSTYSLTCEYKKTVG